MHTLRLLYCCYVAIKKTHVRLALIFMNENYSNKITNRASTRFAKIRPDNLSANDPVRVRVRYLRLRVGRRACRSAMFSFCIVIIIRVSGQLRDNYCRSTRSYEHLFCSSRCDTMSRRDVLLCSRYCAIYWRYCRACKRIIIWEKLVFLWANDLFMYTYLIMEHGLVVPVALGNFSPIRYAKKQTNISLNNNSQKMRHSRVPRT